MLLFGVRERPVHCESLEVEVSPHLIAICGVIYLVVAVDLAVHGKTGLAIAYAGYAFSSVGLYMAAR